MELACGTGRVAIRLAEAGYDMVGLDHSHSMLQIARGKSEDIANICWILGDMRSFEINQTFALIIIPGHAFQNLNTPEDQVACLRSIRKHLKAGGRLVIHLDHQDVGLLGEISADKIGVFEAEGGFTHPTRGSRVTTSSAWFLVIRTSNPNRHFRDRLGEVGRFWEGHQQGGKRSNSTALCLPL